MNTKTELFGRALSAAFVADVMRSPALMAAMEDGQLAASDLRALILRDIAQGPERNGTGSLFPNLRALIEAQVDMEASGMGFWDDIASIVTTVATAGISYITAKKMAEAQKKAAEAQARLEEAKARQAEAQAVETAKAQEQAAAARVTYAESGGAPVSAIQSGGGGLPSWVLPAGGVAAAAALVYFATKG
jgi:hypothetical protein